jgi:hypothetical protein
MLKVREKEGEQLREIKAKERKAEIGKVKEEQ